MTSRSSGSALRTTMLSLLVLGLVAAGGFWLALSQARSLVERALSIALGPGVGTQRSITLDRDGQVRVEGLVFRPDGGGGAIHAERAHVETPGWRWFARNLLDPALHTARLDRLRLSLNGVRVDAADALPEELAAFGASTASPWAAEGCPPDVEWTPQALADAGLAPGSTALEFDYRVEAGQLIAATSLENHGVSRVRWLRFETPPVEGNLLLLSDAGGLTHRDVWEVQDQGFVAARNRQCADRLDTDPRRFVDRHLGAVARVLMTRDLHVDDDTRDRYRRFALAGGRISLSVTYDQPMSRAALRQLHQSAAWSGTRATLARRDDAGEVRWRDAAPPVASDAATSVAEDAAQSSPTTAESSVDAVVAADDVAPVSSSADAAIESSVEPPTEATVDPVAVPIESAASPDSSSDTSSPAPSVDLPTHASAAQSNDSVAAASAPPRAETPPVAPAVPSADAVAGPTPERASTQEPRDAVAAAPVLPRAIPPLTRFVTPTPESALRAAALANAHRATATEPSVPKALRWDELRVSQGDETVDVWTTHSPARRVRILAIDEDTMRVSYQIKNNGEALFNIRRAAFLRAVLQK